LVVLTSGVFVVLPRAVVEGMKVLVVSGAVTVTVVVIGAVVSTDAVVVSWTVVVLASAVVDSLPHWHSCDGQKGVT